MNESQNLKLLQVNPLLKNVQNTVGDRREFVNSRFPEKHGNVNRINEIEKAANELLQMIDLDGGLIDEQYCGRRYKELYQ